MDLPVSLPASAWTHVPILLDRTREDGTELTEDEVRAELGLRRLVAATFSGEDYGLLGLVGVALAVDGEGRVATGGRDGRLSPAQPLAETLPGLAYRFRTRLVVNDEIEILPDGTEREHDGQHGEVAKDSRVVYAWPSEDTFDEHLVASAAETSVRVHRTDGWTIAAQPHGIATRMPDPRTVGITHFPFVVAQRRGRLHLVEWVTGSKPRAPEGVAVHFPHVTPLPVSSEAGTAAHELAGLLARPTHLESWYGAPDDASEETSRVREWLEQATTVSDGEEFLTVVLERLGVPSLAARLALEPVEADHPEAVVVAPSATPIRSAAKRAYREDVAASLAADGVVVDPSDTPLRTAAKQMFFAEIDTEPEGDSWRARSKRWFFHRPGIAALLATWQPVLAVVVVLVPLPFTVPGWLRWTVAALLAASWAGDLAVLARRARRKKAGGSSSERSS